MLHVQESVNLTIYLYATQWRVTNMARNDLRAQGGLGGRSAPPTRCWGGAKHHPQQLSLFIKVLILNIFKLTRGQCLLEEEVAEYSLHKHFS